MVENLSLIVGNGETKIDYENLDESEKRLFYRINYTVKKVTGDIERFHFNTDISALMELTNELYRFISEMGLKEKEKANSVFTLGISRLIELLSPFTPHITEELWNIIGRDGMVSTIPWPSYDSKFLEVKEKNIAVQVNGKVRGTILVNEMDDEETVEEKAKSIENVRRFTAKGIKRVIYIKDKIVSIVAEEN